MLKYGYPEISIPVICDLRVQELEIQLSQQWSGMWCSYLNFAQTRTHTHTHVHIPILFECFIIIRISNARL